MVLMMRGDRLKPNYSTFSFTHQKSERCLTHDTRGKSTARAFCSIIYSGKQKNRDSLCRYSLRINPRLFRFGVIDAGSLVEESLKWKNAPERKSCIVGEMEVEKKTFTGGEPVELSFDTGF